MGKLSYLVSSTRKRIAQQPRFCPSCGHVESRLIQRKFVVTELRECSSCHLLFRYPLDTYEENETFYQEEYSQGFTSDCPDESQLEGLLASGFAGHQKDYRPYLEVISALGVQPAAKIIDFGCSWGYGTWQMERAGYSVQGFEISRPRARYGREKLGVEIVDSLNAVRGGADVFFSAHVLEHVPSVEEAIQTARRLVRPGGLFIAFTPNGSSAFRKRNEAAFRKLWNQVHPNLLSDQFYRTAFGDRGLLLASPPYPLEALQSWNRKSLKVLDVSGDELLAVALL